jgi:hypothetical protein
MIYTFIYQGVTPEIEWIYFYEKEKEKYVTGLKKPGGDPHESNYLLTHGTVYLTESKALRNMFLSNDKDQQYMAQKMIIKDIKTNTHVSKNNRSSRR